MGCSPENDDTAVDKEFLLEVMEVRHYNAKLRHFVISYVAGVQLNERAEDLADASELTAFGRELDAMLDETATKISDAFETRDIPRAKVCSGLWWHFFLSVFCFCLICQSLTRGAQELLVHMRFYRSIRQTVLDRQDSL